MTLAKFSKRIEDANSNIPFQQLSPNVWSPDGNNLVLPLPNPEFDENDGRPYSIYIMPITGGLPTKIADGSFAIWSR